MGTQIEVTPIHTAISGTSITRDITVTDISVPTITVSETSTLLSISEKKVNLTLTVPKKIVVEISRDVSRVIIASTLALSTVGPVGPVGPKGDSTVIDWLHYIGNSKYLDKTTVIVTGDVLEYTYDLTATTVYRHITTAVTGLYPTEDAFYSGFNGSSLSNLIVGR
jgi:hypothetical protein